MSQRSCLIASLLLGLCAVPSVAAGQDEAVAPLRFQALLDCRTIADPEQRLTCYDTQVAAVEEARAGNDLIVADREQVREAKRGVFGFTLPQLKLLSREGDEEIDEIEMEIVRLSSNPAGKFIFVLEDGAVWAQTDTQPIYPRKGDKIRIRRAAMGSFLANINGGSAVRVRRQN